MSTDPDSDAFRPPAVNTEVGCLHCQEVYDSYQIEWREGVCDDGRVRGFWCCPTPGCGGRGFGFDILPTDPDYRDEHGDRIWLDDEPEEADGDGPGPPGGLDQWRAGPAADPAHREHLRDRSRAAHPAVHGRGSPPNA